MKNSCQKYKDMPNKVGILIFGVFIKIGANTVNDSPQCQPDNQGDGSVLIEGWNDKDRKPTHNQI